MPKKTRLAIFDIDGTIFRSSLLIELFNELVRRGVFPRKASQAVERNYLAWLDRKGHYNDYLIQLVRVHYDYQTGCTPQQIEPAIRAVISWHKDRLYRYTRDLARSLKKKGYYLLAISNSPQPLVEQFSKEIGFHAAIGRELEVVGGKYTQRNLIDGMPVPVIGQIDKVGILKRFIARQNFTVDLKQSIMVGDSEGDLPLLSFVGRPIAFNPSAKLAHVAKRRGWQIVIERKDVVYDVKDTRFVPIQEKQKAYIPQLKK